LLHETDRQRALIIAAVAAFEGCGANTSTTPRTVRQTLRDTRAYRAQLNLAHRWFSLPPLDANKRVVSSSCGDQRIGQASIETRSCFRIEELNRPVSCADGRLIPSSVLRQARREERLSFETRPASVLVWSYRLDGQGASFSARHPKRFGKSAGPNFAPRAIRLHVAQSRIVTILASFSLLRL